MTGQTLSLLEGGKILTSTVKGGSGGKILINETDAVTISGHGAVPSVFRGVGFRTDPSSGLFSTAEAGSSGPAGKISVTAPSLTVSDGAKISVATLGTGPAGDVALNVGALNVLGGAQITSSTSGVGPGSTGGAITLTAGSVELGSKGGLFSTAQGAGSGGSIDVQANRVDLTGGATISAQSSGRGNAGNITIQARDEFMVRDSAVTTQATVADGGNVLVTSGNMLRLEDSKITTSVRSGFGKGGNITIDPQFIVLRDSQIRADAFGGPGGNINIFGNVFLTSNSIVSASSALSTPGVIDIQAQTTDVSNNVAQLPQGVLQAAGLLRASCATRFAAGRLSSLVVAGRDAVPTDPAGPLPSPLVAEDSRVAGGEGPEWDAIGVLGLPLLSASTGDGRLCW